MLPMVTNAVPRSNSMPLVRFHRLTAETRLPQRADRSAGGTIPARAARFCDAITAASAFGYYIFPPMDLSLVWDGSDIFWTYSGVDRWLPLVAAQFPYFRAAFDDVAPPDLIGCAPPFLSALPEPGHIQIWTGLFARTAPDWSLLLRPIANLPQTGGYVAYEGIVETDRWFGPLFTNLRLTRTDMPIRINAQLPLVQAQPLPRWVYSDATLDHFETTMELKDLTEADWDGYRRSIVLPNAKPDRPLGTYAVEARRRRRCPVSDAPHQSNLDQGNKPAQATLPSSME